MQLRPPKHQNLLHVDVVGRRILLLVPYCVASRVKESGEMIVVVVVVVVVAVVVVEVELLVAATAAAAARISE